MELLINGDIYIKIEPDIIKPNEEKIEELKGKIYKTSRFSYRQNRR